MIHIKEYKILYLVKKARELRRLNALSSPRYKRGEQIKIKFICK